MSEGEEQRALRAALERRFRTVWTTVPLGEHELEVLHPASAEDLISEADFDRDERLPYWADLWPSARVLAGLVIEESGTGHHLLELGCGSGLVTAAAAVARFDVMATDYYDDALLFARANAWHNAGESVRTRMVDWRAFPDDLGRYDLVVASDVLYERPYAALVAAAFARTIAPRGRGLLTDPGRFAAAAFVEECGRLGLDVKKADRVPFVEGPVRQNIDVYELRLAR